MTPLEKLRDILSGLDSGYDPKGAASIVCQIRLALREIVPELEKELGSVEADKGLPTAEDVRGIIPLAHPASQGSEAGEDNRALLQFVGWVDSWVSNPVGAYSVYALDGLFRTTREKIAALSPATMRETEGNGG